MGAPWAPFSVSLPVLAVAPSRSNRLPSESMRRPFFLKQYLGTMSQSIAPWTRLKLPRTPLWPPMQHVSDLCHQVHTRGSICFQPFHAVYESHGSCLHTHKFMKSRKPGITSGGCSTNCVPLCTLLRARRKCYLRLLRSVSRGRFCVLFLV